MADVASFQMKILLAAYTAFGEVLSKRKIGLAVKNGWQINERWCVRDEWATAEFRRIKLANRKAWCNQNMHYVFIF